jgi:hypothetical protein
MVQKPLNPLALRGRGSGFSGSGPGLVCSGIRCLEKQVDASIPIVLDCFSQVNE